MGKGPLFAVSPSDTARAPCPSGTRPIASYSISSAMVKQSCVSTKERLESATPALARARAQACAQPSSLSTSRFDIGKKSCTCSAARKASALPSLSAVATSARTTAAAPSETSEQSVRLSGPARSEEHTSELQSRLHLVCRLL